MSPAALIERSGFRGFFDSASCVRFILKFHGFALGFPLQRVTRLRQTSPWQAIHGGER